MRPLFHRALFGFVTCASGLGLLFLAPAKLHGQAGGHAAHSAEPRAASGAPQAVPETEAVPALTHHIAEAAGPDCCDSCRTATCTMSAGCGGTLPAVVARPAHASSDLGRRAPP